MIRIYPNRAGSLASIFSGMLFAFSGILFIFFQANRFNWNSIRTIIEYIDSTPNALTIWTLINWGAALASLLAIANVIVITFRFRGVCNVLVGWMGLLAVIGYSIISVTNVADLHKVQQLARGYSTLDIASQDIIEVLGLSSLDPDLNLRFLTLGPWFLVIGALALLRHHFPRPLAYLGLILGGAALSLVLANWLDQTWLLPVAAIIAVILHPVWLIWTGITLQDQQKGSTAVQD